MPHERVSPAPRSQTRMAIRSACVHAHELDVRAAREAGVVLEDRTVHRDRHCGRVVDEEHEVRVPHAGRVTPVEHAVGDAFQLERVVDRDRDPRGLEGDRSHVHVGGHDRAAGGLEPHSPPARRGLDVELAVPGQARACAATHARQRMPLPLISAAPPSAFTSVIVQSAPAPRVRS